MPSLDRLPLPISRRRLLGLGLAAAFPFAGFDQALAQDADAYTFLVLGLDTREENTDQRADVMMVARVDFAAGTVRGLSIPRDLWVEIPGHGMHKINAAYQIGLAETPNLDWEVPADLTAETIDHNLGVTIDAKVMTDMNRFPAIIDAVGGVDIVNPYDLGEPDAATNLIFPAGPLHLDGEQALLFSRLRHQDSDDGRVMRQHLVLEALLRRVQDPEVMARLPELIAQLSNAVKHDVPITTQLRLIAMVPDLSSDGIAFTNIADQCWADWSDDGQWIYAADWTTLPGYVQAWLDGEIE